MLNSNVSIYIKTSNSYKGLSYIYLDVFHFYIEANILKQMSHSYTEMSHSFIKMMHSYINIASHSYIDSR